MADSLITYLNSLGYNPVFLPTTGVLPPQLYNFGDRHLVRLGPLSTYLRRNALAPRLHEGKVSEIELRRTRKRNLSAAFSFLGNALRFLGLTSGPNLDLSLDGGAGLVFSVSGVIYQRIDPGEVAMLVR